MNGNPTKDMPIGLVVKLGSIIAHVKELRSPHGDETFDGGAIDSLLSDPQVKGWLEDMQRMALIPVPRSRP